jgi:hypothetical protein
MAKSNGRKNGKRKNGGSHDGGRPSTHAERVAAHAVIRRALVDDAIANPWRLFTAEQIADIMVVSIDLVLAVKRQNDSPFPANKTRPEWVVQWLQHHPEFQIKTAKFS